MTTYGLTVSGSAYHRPGPKLDYYSGDPLSYCGRRLITMVEYDMDGGPAGPPLLCQRCRDCEHPPDRSEPLLVHTASCAAVRALIEPLDAAIGTADDEGAVDRGRHLRRAHEYLNAAWWTAHKRCVRDAVEAGWHVMFPERDSPRWGGPNI